MSRGSGAGVGAVLGALGAAALIVLPVAFGSAEARQVEWLYNVLFVAVPLVLLGALFGTAAAGRRARDYGVLALGAVVIVLVVLMGTTSILT